MGLRTLSIETLCVLKLDKHSYQIHINLSFICLTLLCLICALSLYLAQKLLRKVKIPQVCKNRKKLLQMPKCAQMLPSTIGTGVFECSSRYLTRSLPLLVRYRVEHKKRNSRSTSNQALFCLLYKHNRPFTDKKMNK